MITWFQNRRAKLKRDVEDLKNHNKTINQLPEDHIEIKSESLSDASKKSQKRRCASPTVTCHKKAKPK